MKKDNIRDYAVDAFRYFASLHTKPTKDAVKFELQKKHLSKGCKKSDCRMLDAELLDMYAVVDTIDAINALPNAKEILQTLQIVYFSNPTAPIKRGEIENRVLYTTFQTHISTATVYRHLSTCRRLFAEARGLRCSYTVCA